MWWYRTVQLLVINVTLLLQLHLMLQLLGGTKISISQQIAYDTPPMYNLYNLDTCD